MNGQSLSSTTYTYFLSGVPYWFQTTNVPIWFSDIQQSQDNTNPIKFVIDTIVTNYTQLNIDFGDKTTASINITSND